MNILPGSIVTDGEKGLKQQEIQVGNGEIYVHFWQSDDYEIQISDPDYQQKGTEMRRPRMQLVGQDGNVFSILARANKLLQANGQGQEAKEMIARVPKIRELLSGSLYHQ